MVYNTMYMNQTSIRFKQIQQKPNKCLKNGEKTTKQLFRLVLRKSSIYSGEKWTLNNKTIVSQIEQNNNIITKQQYHHKTTISSQNNNSFTKQQ